MTEVPLSRALGLVEVGLREDVVPAVDDPHATSALKSALQIVRIAISQLEMDQRWHRDLLGRALPEASGWPDALRATAPEAADEVAASIARAAAAAEHDAVAGRHHLLDAARRGLVEVWRDPALHVDAGLLRSLRRVVRMDIEAHRAVSR